MIHHFMERLIFLIFMPRITIMVLLVLRLILLNMITKEVIFINGFYIMRYDESKATIHMHDGLYVPPLASIS